MAEDCCSFQLISGNGVFNVEGLENFARTTDFSQRRLSYAVVAIIGPQSSGKSTLLNELFQTKFSTMNAYKGRRQTTKGIWIAKGLGMKPFTITMDLEGTDSSEKGQDGTTFEKQSALFSLAIADIIIINMWCHDIGREHAASRPLLKTVFEVMMRLFGARKTTLLFVLRDETLTPLELLKRDLRQDIEKIWAAVAKPDAHKRTPLSGFFNVEITALPSYEREEEKFKEQVALLRQLFFNSISPAGLAGDRKVQPASGFSDHAQQIWKTIKENKDLHLPAIEEMVATVRCEQIAKEMLGRLNSDKTWLATIKDVKTGRGLSEFGEKLSSILENYLSQYDEKAKYFKESIRNDRRQELETKALNVVFPAYVDILRHLHSIALESFKTRLEKKVKAGYGDGYQAFIDDCARSSLREFEEGCQGATIKQVDDWAAQQVKIKQTLRRDIEKLKSQKIAEAEKKMAKAQTLNTRLYPTIEILVGITVGLAMMAVSDPITATATGLGTVSATSHLFKIGTRFFNKKWH